MMKQLSLALNWGFGMLFLVLGLVGLFVDLWRGLPFLAMSLLLLPPVRTKVHAIFGFTLRTRYRAVLIVILLAAFFYRAEYNPEENERKKMAEKESLVAESAEKKKKQVRDEFAANRESILSDGRDLLNRGDYEQVLAIGKKYTLVSDSELNELIKKAKKAVAEQQGIEETKKLIQKVATLNESNIESLSACYNRLSQLNPDNEEYKQKASSYAAKVADQRQKELKKAERKKKIEAQFSGWDGSHRNLERYIKRAMNDPSSYNHVETTYLDRGDYIIVETTFRGKNALGAIVKNTIRAKVSLDGDVLGILE